MRDIGIPKLLAWRWTPFAALVLGSLSFVGFVTLVVPEKIGGALEGASASSLRLGNHFGRTQTPQTGAADPSSDLSSSDEGQNGVSPPSGQATRVATHGPQQLPKRGFSPPLERADPPPPPPPPPMATPSPPPGMPQQPTLAVPPMQDAPQPPPQQVAIQPDAAPPPPDAPPPN